MPELPEVEIVKRSLFKMINKAKFIDIKIFNKKLRYKIQNTLAKQLIGQRILKISRRSKYLIFKLKDKLLLIHLGMSGKILIMRAKDKKIFKTSFYYNLNILHKHNHVYFKLSNGLVLIYNDVRRFGFIKLFNFTNLKKIVFIQKLGLEPFDKSLNIKYFNIFIKNKEKNIKNLLMDQTFISGLGNIYVNEVLFVCKIHPLRSCNKLQEKEKLLLIKNIRKILQASISKGGSSIKDFNNTQGKIGNFQQFFKVYGRDGKKCSRISCKGKIKKISMSNRSSFYCNICQI